MSVKPSNSLVKINVRSLRAEMLSGDTTLAESCRRAGIDDENVDRYIEVITRYRAQPAKVVELAQRGITPERIDKGYEISRSRIRYSVEMALVIMEGTNFHDESQENQVFEMFDEVCERVGGKFPAYRLFYFIFNNLGGDILLAYKMAVDDVDDFAAKVRSRRSV